MVLDFSFAVAFIYIAAANGTGAGSCRGDVTTQFGTGNSSEKVDNNDNGGFTALPTYGQACQLESAVLGVSVVAIFFFVFSLLLELAMGRQHWHHKRENMILPDPDGPMGPGGVHLGPEVSEKPGSYTIGHTKKNEGGGFLQRLFGRNKVADSGSDGENMLPQHPTPNEVEQHPPAGHDTPVENHNAGETYVFSQSGPAVGDNSISGLGAHATSGYLAPSLYEGMTYNGPYRYDISPSSGVDLSESYNIHLDSSSTHAYMSSGALGYDIGSRADQSMGTFHPYYESAHGRISRPT
ncbi:uncharacterized protein BROUX77_008150 [Berkeleyomyces rouxiae]|uniref:uncharacterized protein n=1 Tax=Berkeleyomyces rouxiae TaxID=2035830 RepID=UPI003B82034E